MIVACTGFGGDYKPSNLNLTVASMTTLLTDVGVRPRTTQLLAGFRACGADANKVDLLTFNDETTKFTPNASLVKGVICGLGVSVSPFDIPMEHE